MVRRLLPVATLVLTLALPGAMPASGARTPRKYVKVGDDFFAPARLRVKPGTQIVWRWSPDNSHVHDVRLAKPFPRKVKRFASDLVTTDFTFRRTLRARGTYRIFCSVHSVRMRQTIVVR